MTQPALANDRAAISQSLMETSDEWLVMAAKAGNIDAFTELRNRHFRGILRKTYRITRNWEDAEDALQDAFLKAFTHLHGFEGRARFSSWVTRIAINMSLMILRKKRANKEFSIDASGDDCISDDRWELRDIREDPERRYARRETAQLVSGKILRLRPDFRTALELQHAQECSLKEIADSLGISSAAAKSRLLRARLRLRTLIENESLKSNRSQRTTPGR